MNILPTIRRVVEKFIRLMSTFLTTTISIFNVKKCALFCIVQRTTRSNEVVREFFRSPSARLPKNLYDFLHRRFIRVFIHISVTFGNFPKEERSKIDDSTSLRVHSLGERSDVLVTFVILANPVKKRKEEKDKGDAVNKDRNGRIVKRLHCLQRLKEGIMQIFRPQEEPVPPLPQVTGAIGCRSYLV